jgi:hypothetical protein
VNQSNAADLSVIVITPDRYATIRGTIRNLQRQTARDRLEIVVVAPRAAGLGVDPADFTCFFGLQVVSVGAITSSAAARAAGIRAAHAPVVAFVEDHSFPEPRWAEVLIEAHGQPWAAVGPAMANANPDSMMSWANLVVEYLPWLEATGGREIEQLPGHNSSYKRAPLLDYGARLETLLEAESVLQWDLQARGFRLYLAATKTYHQNMTYVGPTLAVRFHGGRLFAAARARGWAPLRRLLYAGAAPLIPLVRLSRILRHLGRSAQLRGLLPRMLPALIAVLAVDGAGEMVGYALGGGDAVQRSSQLEFHREQHLDRQAASSRVGVAATPDS